MLSFQSFVASLDANLSPAELRKATLKWEKEQANTEAIEKKRELAKKNLGELYYRYSLEQSLTVATIVKEEQEKIDSYKDCLPKNARIIGKVERQGDLLGLFVSEMNSDGTEETDKVYAVGMEEKTRAGKTVVSVGSIVIQACLKDYLFERFYKDFPSFAPVEEDTSAETIALVQQAA